MGSQQLCLLQRVEQTLAIMKFFLTLAALFAAANAEAGIGYGYHQQSWPSVKTYGFERTCYGCRGKRDADAEPGYGLSRGIARHPTGISYSNRSPQGLGAGYGYGLHHGYGKRDAEPGYGIGLSRGIARHPTGISYSNRSPQGLGAGYGYGLHHGYGKRDAEPGY